MYVIDKGRVLHINGSKLNPLSLFDECPAVGLGGEGGRGGREGGSNKTSNSATLLQSGAGGRVESGVEEIGRTKKDFLFQQIISLSTQIPPLRSSPTKNLKTNTIFAACR